MINICGNKALSEYRTTDAGKVRDILIYKGLNVLSIKRIFTTIGAISNLAIAEQGLNIRNAFSSIYMPDAISKMRVFIPVNIICEIQ